MKNELAIILGYLSIGYGISITQYIYFEELIEFMMKNPLIRGQERFIPQMKAKLEDKRFFNILQIISTDAISWPISLALILATYIISITKKDD